MFKLLIADDEPIERSTLALIVSRSFDNIEVVGEASNGREAIAKAQELKPDIIVMDIKMPGINGVEAAKTIKAASCHIKVIIVTAYDYYDYVIESMKIGIDDFLLKPVLKEDLEASLKNIIRKIEAEETQKQYEENVTRKLKELSSFLEHELISTILVTPEAQQVQSYFDMLDIKFDQACGMLVSINEAQPHVHIADSARRKVYSKRVYGKVLKSLEGLGVKFVAAELNNWLYILFIKEQILDKDFQSYSLNKFGKMSPLNTHYENLLANEWGPVVAATKAASTTPLYKDFPRLDKGMQVELQKGIADKQSVDDTLANLKKLIDSLDKSTGLK